MLAASASLLHCRRCSRFPLLSDLSVFALSSSSPTPLLSSSSSLPVAFVVPCISHVVPLQLGVWRAQVSLQEAIDRKR